MGNDSSRKNNATDRRRRFSNWETMAMSKTNRRKRRERKMATAQTDKRQCFHQLLSTVVVSATTAVSYSFTVLASDDSSPSPSPSQPTDIYRPPAVSITVVAMATAANAFAFASGIFFFIERNNRIVAAGQPPFLYMVVFGSMLIASSVYFTANDESAGRSVESMNRSCTASTWFSYMGNIIVYMALFSKLWRVERVTQFRRKQKVMVHHVILPMIVMCLAIIGILLAYTFQDPPQWTRQNLNSDPLGKSDQSFGFCTYNAAYVLPMNILIVISIVLVLVMSCLTRERIPEDLTDSERIFQTISAHFILWVFGIIVGIVAVAIDSNLLLYFSSAFVSVLASICSVAFLSIPKMYYVHYQKTTGKMPEGLRGHTRVSGLPLSNPTLSTTRNQQPLPAPSYAVPQRVEPAPESNTALGGINDSPLHLKNSLYASIPDGFLPESPPIQQITQGLETHSQIHPKCDQQSELEDRNDAIDEPKNNHNAGGDVAE